jgi:threonine dehydrogenase-like Zn-dependent dehydrogenase
MLTEQLTDNTSELDRANTMNVLIVGAGAVGQLFGYFAARGGCKITFLVKVRPSA